MRIRTRLGVSQYQLARLSGISGGYLNKLENAKREPRISTIIRLGRALGIAPGAPVDETDRLMREEEAPCGAGSAGDGEE